MQILLSNFSVVVQNELNMKFSMSDDVQTIPGAINPINVQFVGGDFQVCKYLGGL